MRDVTAQVSSETPWTGMGCDAMQPPSQRPWAALPLIQSSPLPSAGMKLGNTSVLREGPCLPLQQSPTSSALASIAPLNPPPINPFSTMASKHQGAGHVDPTRRHREWPRRFQALLSPSDSRRLTLLFSLFHSSARVAGHVIASTCRSAVDAIHNFIIINTRRDVRETVTMIRSLY